MPPNVFNSDIMPQGRVDVSDDCNDGVIIMRLASSFMPANLHDIHRSSVVFALYGISSRWRFS